MFKSLHPLYTMGVSLLRACVRAVVTPWSVKLARLCPVFSCWAPDMQKCRQGFSLPVDVLPCSTFSTSPVNGGKNVFRSGIRPWYKLLTFFSLPYAWRSKRSMPAGHFSVSVRSHFTDPTLRTQNTHARTRAHTHWQFATQRLCTVLLCCHRQTDRLMRVADQLHGHSRWTFCIFSLIFKTPHLGSLGG